MMKRLRPSRERAVPGEQGGSDGFTAAPRTVRPGRLQGGLRPRGRLPEILEKPARAVWESDAAARRPWKPSLMSTVARNLPRITAQIAKLTVAALAQDMRIMRERDSALTGEVRSHGVLVASAEKSAARMRSLLSVAVQHCADQRHRDASPAGQRNLVQLGNQFTRRFERPLHACHNVIDDFGFHAQLPVGEHLYDHG